MARVKSKKYTGVYYNELRNGDKSYYCTYTDAAGKKVWFKIGKKSDGNTEKLAFNKRQEFVGKVRLGEVPAPVQEKRKKNIITLDSVAQEHYEAKALHNRANKWAKKRYELHIKPTLGNRDITAITISQIKKLQQEKAKKFSPKHTNNIMGDLSTIYTHAIQNGIVIANPMKQIKKLKVDNERTRFLSKDEINRLLKAVKDNDSLYTFMLLALNTGARVGAICKLKAGDINFQHGTISMLDEKNAKTYTCFLEDDHLIEMLHKRIATVGKHKYIVDDGMAESNLTDRVKRAAGKVLDDLFNDKDTNAKDRAVVHTLRHTFASQLAINSVPILTIQKLMNHSDISQTMRYAKLAPDSGRDALKGLYRE